MSYARCKAYSYLFIYFAVMFFVNIPLFVSTYVSVINFLSDKLAQDQP